MIKCPRREDWNNRIELRAMTCGDGLFHQKEYQSNQNEVNVDLRGDGSFGMRRRIRSYLLLKQQLIDTSEWIIAAVMLWIICIHQRRCYYCHY